MDNKLKVLCLDIETTPIKTYLWGMYQELNNYDMVIDEWYILTWAAKWLGDTKVMSSSLPDFPKEYKKDPKNDKHILIPLKKLLEEADIVVAHNGYDFDRRKINTRLHKNGLGAVPRYRMVDTLLVARRNLSFTSNKLTDLCKFLGLGCKVATGGFQLWIDCMKGDKKAWNHMEKYCRYDVTLLEKLYYELLPWIDSHPNMGVKNITERPTCPKCGSDKIQMRGTVILNSGKFNRFQCQVCGGWSRDKHNLFEKGDPKKLLVNA